MTSQGSFSHTSKFIRFLTKFASKRILAFVGTLHPIFKFVIISMVQFTKFGMTSFFLGHVTPTRTYKLMTFLQDSDCIITATQARSATAVTQTRDVL